MQSFSNIFPYDERVSVEQKHNDVYVPTPRVAETSLDLTVWYDRKKGLEQIGVRFPAYFSLYCCVLDFDQSLSWYREATGHGENTYLDKLDVRGVWAGGWSAILMGTHVGFARSHDNLLAVVAAATCC